MAVVKQASGLAGADAGSAHGTTLIDGSVL